MHNPLTQKISDREGHAPKGLMLLLVFIYMSRALAMAFFPLTDATEARYGEIARLMAETGNWITPQYDYGVPFWAKPPLSTWLSAASIRIFGLSDFAVRFPSLVLSLAVLWLVWRLSAGYLTQAGRYAVVLVLSSMSLFYVVSGTVMTDEVLVLTCTMVLTAFWFMVEKRSRAAGYAMFFALGLGLLAKGPVVWALTGISAAVWLFWARRWGSVFKAMPLLGGTVLMLVVGVPWYIAAEIKTPGFLQYFLVGENFDRFTKPGWNGDLYGHAHAAPLGTIWIYVLLSSLPWLPLALVRLYRQTKGRFEAAVAGMDDMTKFLICWFMVPNLFFTFAHNIIITYPLVSLPPLALLVVKILEPVLAGNGGKLRPRVYVIGALVPALVLAGLVGFTIHVPRGLKTAAYIGRTYEAQGPRADEKLLYVGSRIYSIEYYTQGGVRRFDSIDAAIDYGRKNNCRYIALNDKQAARLSMTEGQELHLVTSAPPGFMLFSILPKKEGSGT